MLKCSQISTGIGAEARDSIADMSSLSEIFSNGSALLGNTFSRMRSMSRRQRGWFCNMLLFIILVAWIFVCIRLTDHSMVVAAIMYSRLLRLMLLSSRNSHTAACTEHRKTRQVAAPLTCFCRIGTVVEVQSKGDKVGNC